MEQVQTPGRAKLVKHAGWLLGTTIGGLALAGCAQQPPPPVNLAVPVNPNVPNSPTYPADYPKQMPDQTADNTLPPPSYDDPPLVTQRLPEEDNFVRAYNRVGRPRVAVFVNRTLDGSLEGQGDVVASRTEHTQSSTGGVDVQHSEGGASADWAHAQANGNSDSFKSNGSAEYHESTTVYLHPGQYDDAQLQALDYLEMESLVTDWVGCNGQVTLLSPGFIRSHLNDQQIQSLQSGKASGLNDLGQATQADVLVQIQAHPVKRGDQLVVLLVAEAVNIRGGESIGHASVEMPTPIDRYKLNNFTRFLTRKLLLGMVGTWNNAPLPPATPAVQPAPPAQPVPPVPVQPAPQVQPAPPVVPAPPATQPAPVPAPKPLPTSLPQ